MIAAVSMPLPGRYSVEETEAIVVEQVLVLAKELGLEKIIIEGDSLLTIQAVETMDVRGVVGHIIKVLGRYVAACRRQKSNTLIRTATK